MKHDQIQRILNHATENQLKCSQVQLLDAKEQKEILDLVNQKRNQMASGQFTFRGQTFPPASRMFEIVRIQTSRIFR